MLQNIKTIILSVAAICLVLVVAPAPVANAARGDYCASGLLTFPTWYSHISSDCKSVEITQLNDLWIIVLNLIEMLLQAVAYASTGFLVWGGFKYMKSRGDPSRIQNAKDAITNALIGLGVALGSVAIVSFISGAISGGTRNGIPVVSAGVGALATMMNNVVFPIAGAVAVIFIIIGGFQYVTSNGDSGETKKARYTIIYSLVGLVFVVMAFAIVQLILGRFS